MEITKIRIYILAILSAIAPMGMAQAQLAFDQNITTNVIFGTGNTNEGFTTDSSNSTVELGLRAKLRFDETNQPQAIYNSDGAGNYLFDAVLPPTGFGFAANSTSTAIWNFEWSVNSNTDGNGGTLDSLTYELGIDFDAGEGVTNYLVFDPIIVADPDYADHSIGTNATTDANDSVASDRVDYVVLLATNNVAQNSWNMEFFDGGSFLFDGTEEGE